MKDLCFKGLIVCPRREVKKAYMYIHYSKTYDIKGKEKLEGFTDKKNKTKQNKTPNSDEPKNQIDIICFLLSTSCKKTVK